MTVARLKCISV